MAPPLSDADRTSCDGTKKPTIRSVFLYSGGWDRTNDLVINSHPLSR